MKRFWETVTSPILKVLQPETIVEVGSDQGGNTEKLLQYCHQNDATLHVIDPAPGYDAEEWQQKSGERLVFHKDLSLNALPEIEDFDVVLIDGDHNWYTVFNELKLIEETCEERSQDFPLVMLHDIGWPYGRRDLYYAPDSIPEGHRKPHDKKGMLPGVTDLVEEGGMNRHLDNAIREREPEGGVLTGVEDFLGASRYELELLELPGIHGLGILVPVQLREQHPELASLLSQLEFSPFVEAYIQGVERDRLGLEIRQQEERRERRKTQQRLTEESRELKEERQKSREERQKLREERQKLQEERQRTKEVRHELNIANRDVLQLTRWLETLDSGVSALLQSRRWKVGSAARELYRRATLKSGEPDVDERLEEVLQKFRAWRGDAGE
jgi:hypothetical protein